MKTTKIISAAIILVSLLATACTKEYMQIEGTGPVITRTLLLEDFSRINITGIDDVVVNYGPVQEVTVKGNGNIISRIETEVINDTWFIQLESGNYGDYELTYYLTLPLLEEVENTGTGNVMVTDFADQENLSVRLTGTGNFYGFPMHFDHADITISGTGNCEVSVEKSLDVSIEGSGNVLYKGYPVIREHISGTGSVTSENN